MWKNRLSYVRDGGNKMRGAFICFLSIWIIAGCQAELTDQTQDPFEIVGDEKDEIIGAYSDSFLEPVERADEVTYSNMISRRLVNIPTSRYQIHTDGEGVITVSDEENNVIFKEVMSFGINEFTLDIRDDYLVEGSGFEWGNIQEVEKAEPSNTLTPGVWQVGEDIHAGEYTISGEGHGYLQIFEHHKEPRVFEVIGNDYVQSSSIVELRKGQKLRINGLPEVNFEPE